MSRFQKISPWTILGLRPTFDAVIKTIRAITPITPMLSDRAVGAARAGPGRCAALHLIRERPTLTFKCAHSGLGTGKYGVMMSLSSYSPKSRCPRAHPTTQNSNLYRNLIIQSTYKHTHWATPQFLSSDTTYLWTWHNETQVLVIISPLVLPLARISLTLCSVVNDIQKR